MIQRGVSFSARVPHDRDRAAEDRDSLALLMRVLSNSVSDDLAQFRGPLRYFTEIINWTLRYTRARSSRYNFAQCTWGRFRDRAIIPVS